MERPHRNRFINPYEEHEWAVSNPGDKNVIMKSIFAGTLASSMQICIFYPFEYIKVQLQLDNAKNKLYHGSLDCARQTIQHYGYKGLYRGLDLMVINGALRAGVRFGSWEYIKGIFVDENDYLSKTGKLFGGLMAGVLEAILVDIPTETVKTKIIKDLRTKNPQYKGLVHAFRTIIKAEGPRGIYRGTTPTMWSLGVAQSVRFFIIDTLEDLYKAGDSQKFVPNAYVGFSAGLAGFVSVFVTQPLDVIKIRLQGDTSQDGVPMFKKILRIWKNEGFKGYYRGTVPRLGTRVFGLATTFMLYDAILKILDKVWKEEEMERKKL